MVFHEAIKNLDSTEIKNSQSEKLLGVTINSQLSFEKHINNIHGKLKANLGALAPAMNFIN